MCFACGPDNPVGLHIDYSVDGNEICTAEFTPDKNHLSWENTVHGGIIYSALDDVTGNIPYARGLVAHTARCEIRYRRALRVGETVSLKGWIEKEKGRLMVIRGEARRKNDNELIAECTASFLKEI
ncbi:MAG: PaaI family thioesterase [Planctomycetes bacterium]|jgi:acyl-coenzyme A thioesterase PaaI-like protein|nr:PaaI family thioesterase [Planctomycetota bacterium]